MFNNPALDKLGRRLRLAVVGEGIDTLIANVHRTASRLDDQFKVVDGAMSMAFQESARVQVTRIAVGVRSSWISSER